MPVEDCQIDGKNGKRWGKHGMATQFKQKFKTLDEILKSRKSDYG